MDTQGWCVKITGLPMNVSALDLSKEFDISANRIILSRKQHHSNDRYAEIIKFKNEKHAKEFASRWDKQYYCRQYQIRCKASDSSVTLNSSNDLSHCTSSGRRKRNYHSRNLEISDSKTSSIVTSHDQMSNSYVNTNFTEKKTNQRSRSSSTASLPSKIPRLSKDIRSHHHSSDDDSCDDNNNEHVNCSRSHPQDGDSKKEEQNLKSFQQRMEKRAATKLPIFASRTEFCQRLKNEKVLVVTAETGSGKSTQLPQYAAEHFPDGLIVCTQPRAVAAMSLAHRVADEYDGDSEGHSVGYRVGGSSGNNTYVSGTRIMFITDAALIRQSHRDPTLSEVHVLIIDEAHDRTLNTDIVVGIAKLLLKQRPDDFYVVISSATIDPTRFLQFFNCPLNQPLKVPGRLYHVSEEYLPPPNDCNNQSLIEKHVVPTVLRLYPKYRGHILVFLPGQRDIEEALKRFKRYAPPDCEALPLYGSMSLEEQDKVLKFDDHNGKLRMVVFCTNVAETSLTIKNVRLVIDSGLAKEARFDVKRRLTVIETVRISRSSANQRKGRAGRTNIGHCARLYNKNELEREYIQPEILRSSLDLTILQILRLGLDPENFPFLDQPDPNSVTSSLTLLIRLSCIDNDKNLTTYGHLFSELALDPRLSAFMTKAYTDVGGVDLLTRAVTIVAIISAPGSIFYMGGSTKETRDEARTRMALGAHEHDSDLFYLSAIYKRWKQEGVIDPTTNKCLTCHKLILQRSNVCRSCRAQYSNTNGLNNKILQIVDSSSEAYMKTITKPHWKLIAAKNKSTMDNERDLIGKYLSEFFPEQLGHLLVSHLPGAGVRLINSDIRARITNTSALAQKLHDHKYQHFVSMSITQLPTGDYLIDMLHPVPSIYLNSVPTCIIFSAKNIGWLVNCKMRQKFEEYRSEPWYKWLVYEYDQTICQLNIWGMNFDEHTVKPILQTILEKVRSELLEKIQTLRCGPIQASFKSGLICTNIEKIENKLRLKLQHVTCTTVNELYPWLTAKLEINCQDIKENNFIPRHKRRNNDNSIDYEARPFYIIFRSNEAFQRASERIPTYYIQPQGSTMSPSTTGAYMGEKDAWGRQLTITTRPGGSVLTAEQVAEKLSPYIVDCRVHGKRIRPPQPGIHVDNLPVDVDETFIRDAVRPIHPIKIVHRPPKPDGTGSSSALIFFANDNQWQMAWNILQSGLCQTSTEIKVRMRESGYLVQKTVSPKIRNVPEKPAPSQTFLITAVNKDIALKLFEEIIPNQEPTWQVNSYSAVTVLQPDIYPDFDQLVLNICQQFDTGVQQQVLEPKNYHGTECDGIRFIFNSASPPKTALAAAMLAQATSPLVIKTSDCRQKYLFDELFEQNLIQTWSRSLNLVTVCKKDKWHSTIEIKGPQIQQGRLMRLISDYSDEFDSRFHVYELSSKIAHFFGPQKAANTKMDQLAQKWSDKGCYVVYIYTKKTIVIYGQPKILLTIINDCAREVKQILSEISADDEFNENNRQCSFCEQACDFPRRLRLCGHAYCRCAPALLTQTFPLQCPDVNCKSNIDIADLRDIYKPNEIVQLCKRSLQRYLLNDANDQIFCPNNKCNGLIKKSKIYQACITCGEHVCALCHIINDDLHEGRTCAERRKLVSQMGHFLQNLFYASEKYVRQNWTPNLPPIIDIQPNPHLVESCLSLERFYDGVTALGYNLPPDLAHGFFAFHGTVSKSIRAICANGFDPSRRKRQLHGEGEYFGVTAAISDGYCSIPMVDGTKSMLVAFILRCPEVSIAPGFCYVVNNPINWSHAYNLPVCIITYGKQVSTLPAIVSTPRTAKSTSSITTRSPPTTTNTASSSQTNNGSGQQTCTIL